MQGRPVTALTIADVIDLMAAEAPAPAAGSAAAVTAGMAAALVAMAARRSRDSWPEASGVAAQALVRRTRCLALVAVGAEALSAAVEALDRGEALEAPLRRTVDVLLQLADAAGDVADLAALTAERCDGQARPDAAAAALLAESAVRAAAVLVRANLTVTEGDERLRWVELVERAASGAARRALQA